MRPKDVSSENIVPSDRIAMLQSIILELGYSNYGEEGLVFKIS